MAITPETPSSITAPNTLTDKATGTVSTPNTLTDKAAGNVSVPNTLTEQTAGTVGAPNSLTGKAVGNVAVPNTVATQSAGSVSVPNTLNEQAVTPVSIPNTINETTASTLPRTLTPLVDLNFSANTFAQSGVSKALSDITTYSRASTATFINRQLNTLGQYEYFVDTAAINTLRIEYDPVTGENLGALIEGSSTNLVTYSEQFDNAVWTKSNNSITQNAIIAPDGTMSADHCGASSSSPTSKQLYQQVTVNSGSTYTHSVFVKSGSINYIQMGYGSGTATNSYCNFNLYTGLIEFKHTDIISANIEFIHDGWYRIQTTVVTNDVVLPNYLFIIDSALAGFAETTTTQVGDGFYLWGCQFEELPFASSYIPTTTSSVSRGADNLNIDYSNVPNQSEEQTVHAKINIDSLGLIISRYIYRTSDNQNAIEVSSTDNLNYFIGSSVIAGASFGLYLNVINNVTVTSDLLNINKYENNSLIGTTSYSAGSSLSTGFGIGQHYNNTGHIFGHISEFKTYNKALTATEVSLL